MIALVADSLKEAKFSNGSGSRRCGLNLPKMKLGKATDEGLKFFIFSNW